MRIKSMEFYNVIEFYQKKRSIKEMYDKLTIDEIEIYKLYVYSLPFMEDNVKDMIWEYLNGSMEAMFDLGKEYRKKLEKLEKRKKLVGENVYDNEEDYFIQIK